MAYLRSPLDVQAGKLPLILFRAAPSISPSFHEWIQRTFQYIPGMLLIRRTPYTFTSDHNRIAINVEHKTERMGAFVTLVFGYSVVALLYQNQAKFGLNV